MPDCDDTVRFEISVYDGDNRLVSFYGEENDEFQDGTFWGTRETLQPVIESLLRNFNTLYGNRRGGYRVYFEDIGHGRI